MINQVNTNPIMNKNYDFRTQQNIDTTAKQQKAISDTVEIGRNSENIKITYDKTSVSKANLEEIDKLWEQSEKIAESIKNLVEKLITRQGLNYNDILAGRQILVIDEEARLEAEEAISEDGELGVKAVSDRIVAFAKAISGNDSSKLSKLKEAIDKGFEEAENIWGGELPDICYDTYDAVMNKLEQWSEE